VKGDARAIFGGGALFAERGVLRPGDAAVYLDVGMPLGPSEICERLASYLRAETGESVRVDNLRPLAGGASRAAIAIDVAIETGPRSAVLPCVLRWDLGGRIYETSLGRVEEMHVIRHAAAGGVPVPGALWATESAAVLERPFLILERIDGETIGRRIIQAPELEAARRHLPGQMGAALARIHALDPGPLHFLPRPRPAQPPAVAVLERARAELDRVGGAHPGLEAGLRWLTENAPLSTSPTLVHGDFRLGNVIVGPEGLRSVLDWEFAAVGDPHEDLAWPFVRDWRFGADERQFAGISDGEDFLAAYEEAGGRRVDRDALRYWEALGNFRWALGCRTQAHRHLSGEEPSVELASLGRRSAEMELEMLDRIAEIAGGAA
jgi:aminoglycoside phosphotransferase (APT) family kinase protein